MNGLSGFIALFVAGYSLWILTFDDTNYSLSLFLFFIIFIALFAFVIALFLNYKKFGEYLLEPEAAKRRIYYKYIVPSLPNKKVAPVPNYHLIAIYQYKPEMLDSLALPYKARIEESRMIRKAVAFLHSYKHVPASLEGGHGGATLWQHSWNVVRVGLAVAHAYQFTPLTRKANLAVLRNMAKAYKGLAHERHDCIDANDPFVFLLLLAHDIGKAYCYAQVAGKWDKVKDRHGPVGATILHALGSPVLLPLHEANALNMIVTYYHVRHFAPSSEFFTEKDYRLLDFLYHVDVLTSAIEEGQLDSFLGHDAGVAAGKESVSDQQEAVPAPEANAPEKTSATELVVTKDEPEAQPQALPAVEGVAVEETSLGRDQHQTNLTSEAIKESHDQVTALHHEPVVETQESSQENASVTPVAEPERQLAALVDRDEERIRYVSDVIANHKKLRNETRRAVILLLNKQEGIMYLDYAWLPPRALIEALLASIPLKEMQADFELSERDFEGNLPIFFRALVQNADKEGAVYYGSDDQVFAAQDAVFSLEANEHTFQTIGIHPVFFGVYKFPANAQVKKITPVSKETVSQREAQNIRARAIIFRKKADVAIVEHKEKSNKKPDVSTVKTKSTFDLVKFLATLGTDAPKEIVLKEDVVLIQREFFEANYIINKSRVKYDIIKEGEIEYYQFRLP